MIRDMAKFQSESAQVDRCFTTYLTDLHVDYDTESREDDPVIYDIAVSNIIELRQQNEGSITLRDIENPLLFRKLLDHIKEDSCLHMCLTYYNISIQRKGKKAAGTFWHWLQIISLTDIEWMGEKLESYLVGKPIPLQRQAWIDLQWILNYFANEDSRSFRFATLTCTCNINLVILMLYFSLILCTAHIPLL